MYLLDPNAVSDLRKRATGRANPGLAAWSATVRPSELHVSVLTLLGLALSVPMTERRDPAQGAVPRRWLEDQVDAGFRDCDLAVDAAVALRCANLHVPDRRPAADALIAATVLV